MSKFYDEKYGSEESYWGRHPSSMARILFQKFLPKEGDQLLEIGSGEGRDAIFFARNGYQVTGFDASAEGVAKAKAWAAEEGLSVDFVQADINSYRPQEHFDVVFSSGALHYIPLDLREEVVSSYKQSTNPGGIHAHMVPIQKPHITTDPGAMSWNKSGAQARFSRTTMIGTSSFLLKKYSTTSNQTTSLS